MHILPHIFIAQTQEREAKEEMKKKAKELKAAAVARGKGGRSVGGFGGGFGGGSRETMPIMDTSVVEPTPPKPSYSTRFVD